jgi:hypothetical protein
VSKSASTSFTKRGTSETENLRGMVKETSDGSYESSLVSGLRLIPVTVPVPTRVVRVVVVAVMPVVIRPPPTTVRTADIPHVLDRLLLIRINFRHRYGHRTPCHGCA